MDIVQITEKIDSGFYPFAPCDECERKTVVNVRCTFGGILITCPKCESILRRESLEFLSASDAADLGWRFGPTSSTTVH